VPLHQRPERFYLANLEVGRSHNISEWLTKEMVFDHAFCIAEAPDKLVFNA
jgi:hypothetical protein